MYVYKDTNARVTFRHPHPGPLYTDIYRGGTKIFTGYQAVPPSSGATSDGSPNVYNHLVLDYKDTQFAGNLRLHWYDGLDFERDQYIEVVTPIAPLWDIEAALIDAGAGEDNPSVFQTKIREMENSVRLIIEAYTGQKFAAYSGIKYATGIPELSKVLNSSISIESITPPLTADLMNTYTDLNIKQAPPEDYMNAIFDGVIRVPNDYYCNVRYVISGVWGVQEIPAPVQEAAMILINEFSCNETLYRDRYLQVVSYGDSRFQFNSQAFSGTGNVKADQLLEDFKHGGMILV